MQIVPSICIHSRPAGAGKINGRIYFPKSTIFPWKVNNISFKTEQHFLRKLNCPFILAKSHKLCDLARLSDTWCSVCLSHREQFPGIFIFCKVDKSVQPIHMWIKVSTQKKNMELFGTFSQHGGVPNSQNYCYPKHSTNKPLNHLKITQNFPTWPKKIGKKRLIFPKGGVGGIPKYSHIFFMNAFPR